MMQTLNGETVTLLSMPKSTVYMHIYKFSQKIRHDKKHIALLWSKHAFVYLLAVSITTVPLCIMIIVGAAQS